MHDAYIKARKITVKSIRRKTTANILGALATALNDKISRTLAQTHQHGESQSAALMTIGTRPGMTIASLSEIIGKQHSTTVRIVSGLEANGLVRRAASQDDARQVELYLTDTGSKRYEDLQKTRLAILTRHLNVLTPSDQRTLHRLVDVLLESTTDDLSGARHICRFCDHSVCRETTCPASRPFL